MKTSTYKANTSGSSHSTHRRSLRNWLGGSLSNRREQHLRSNWSSSWFKAVIQNPTCASSIFLLTFSWLDTCPQRVTCLSWQKTHHKNGSWLMRCLYFWRHCTSFTPTNSARIWHQLNSGKLPNCSTKIHTGQFFRLEYHMIVWHDWGCWLWCTTQVVGARW